MKRIVIRLLAIVAATVAIPAMLTDPATSFRAVAGPGVDRCSLPGRSVGLGQHVY
ncbi:hypothetical protein M2271_001461 [Streptomyces sp. LBL]|uniref:hypothetical protein n=1 Tax=Streptomyces sp. LBL TaxID=2940562 RepID=UPI002474FB46|nr:hypothetical protein [Streptomyces sp. LBL]MDH6623669.1 hypothetical protein [Streptomyces sp. LBL]